MAAGLVAIDRWGLDVWREYLPTAIPGSSAITSDSAERAPPRALEDAAARGAGAATPPTEAPATAPAAAPPVTSRAHADRQERARKKSRKKGRHRRGHDADPGQAETPAEIPESRD